MRSESPNENESDERMGVHGDATSVQASQRAPPVAPLEPSQGWFEELARLQREVVDEAGITSALGLLDERVRAHRRIVLEVVLRSCPGHRAVVALADVWAYDALRLLGALAAVDDAVQRTAKPRALRERIDALAVSVRLELATEAGRLAPWLTRAAGDAERRERTSARAQR